MGQTIDVDVDISANHWGSFELNICPVTERGEDPSQECFDKHPLVLTRDPATHRFTVPLDSPKITRFKYQVKMFLICGSNTSLGIFLDSPASYFFLSSSSFHFDGA